MAKANKLKGRINTSSVSCENNEVARMASI